jgi:hypothetical protein
MMDPICLGFHPRHGRCRPPMFHQVLTCLDDTKSDVQNP